MRGTIDAISVEQARQLNALLDDKAPNIHLINRRLYVGYRVDGRAWNTLWIRGHRNRYWAPAAFLAPSLYAAMAFARRRYGYSKTQSSGEGAV